MTKFFTAPILNSPYEAPRQHWELDADRRPTGNIAPSRRESESVTAVPLAQPAGNSNQDEVIKTIFSKGTEEYSTFKVINRIRCQVDAWRSLPLEERKHSLCCVGSDAF